MYSIVVPVYNSEQSLNELYTRVRDTFEKINEEFELVLVDDSSKDQSYAKMREIASLDKRVKIIQLAKNYGQHAALLCGFSYAEGDFVVTIDDDLQHPPEEIPKLIRTMQESDEIDVVIGEYESKKHSWYRNFGTYLADLVSSYAFKKSSNLKLTSFRLMRKFVVDAMVEQIKVSYPRVGHLLLMVSNRIVNVTVEHDERKYGKSGYTFKRLVKDFFNNILNNSALPLIAARNIGIVCAFISIAIGIFYLIRFFVVGISIQGWTSLMLMIAFFSGLILLTLGVIGEYLMRILTETKKIPNYVVRKVEGKMDEDK